MALIKYDRQTFLEAFGVGLPSIIIKEFEDRLESKLNSIVEDTYEELKKELPEKIEAQLREFLSHERLGSDIRIEVDLGPKEDKES